jgi:hypothetical protein
MRKCWRFVIAAWRNNGALKRIWRRETERSWCETDSERLVTGSGKRERVPDVAWWIVVLYRAQGILGNLLFVLSWHVKACPVVIFLYLHNGVAELFELYMIFGRYDINFSGLRSCPPIVSIFFFSVLFSYLRCIEASRWNKPPSKEVNYSIVWGS